MKIEETLFILTIVGLCRAGKLLKTPRIYNAFVTSDEKLQPSQAYPAIAPVVQGIQYPLPGYIAAPGLYHPFIPYPTFNGATTAGGRSFSYAVKQDYFSYNYFENDAAFAGKVPLIADAAQPAILMPVGFQPLSKEVLPYPPSEPRADTKNEYHDEQQQPRDEDEQNHKNHRPKDPSIVDVPPDPLPIGKSKGKKKPEEYPLAPLGFAL